MPEECWGDWIGEKWGPIKNVHHKMHEDMWSVTKEEHLEAFNAWLDIAYKNGEVCQYKKIHDDVQHWCVEHEGACWRAEGIFGRFSENFFPIIGNMYEQWTILKNNDLCYSDDQLIEEYSRVYKDFWGIMRNLGGFDIKYDLNVNYDHIKTSDFKAERKEYR